MLCYFISNFFLTKIQFISLQPNVCRPLLHGTEQEVWIKYAWRLIILWKEKLRYIWHLKFQFVLHRSSTPSPLFRLVGDSFRRKISVCCVCHTKHIKCIVDKMQLFLYVKAVGIHSHHYTNSWCIGMKLKVEKKLVLFFYIGWKYSPWIWGSLQVA